MISEMKPMNDRPRGIIIVAVLMVLFGFAEVMTGFTHRFFGISTSSVTVFEYAAAAIGGFYVAGGLLILTIRKWAAAFAMILLIADIGGRVALVLTGLYPLGSFQQIFAIVAGMAIAFMFGFTSQRTGNVSNETRQTLPTSRAVSDSDAVYRNEAGGRRWREIGWNRQVRR